MKHPKPEDWVPYVYGETTGVARRELNAHLKECAPCRQVVETFKHGQNRLDTWKLPRRAMLPLGNLAPLLKWATATAAILLVGILIGRVTAPKIDTEGLRSAVTSEIQQEVTDRLAQIAREESAKTVSEALASGRRYTDQVAQQLYVALKKDVDTVAVNADAGLRHTAQQLFQLADYHPAQSPDSPNP